MQQNETNNAIKIAYIVRTRSRQLQICLYEYEHMQTSKIYLLIESNNNINYKIIPKRRESIVNVNERWRRI